MQSTLPEFDTLVALARKDPARLEALRVQLCEELIASAPEATQRRLRGLQFQIDAQRRLTKTPLQACQKISEMMHDSFAELRATLNDLSSNDSHAPARARQHNRAKTHAQSGHVLEFRAVK